MEWSYKLVLLFALVSFNSQAWGAEPKPVFQRRAVKPNARAADLARPVRHQYNTIRGERSLLVPIYPMAGYQVRPGNAFTNKYSLMSLFSIGVSQTGGKLQDLQGQWFKDATTKADGQAAPFGATMSAGQNIWSSFRLLAVVNRLDLAVWKEGEAGRPGKWTQSEVRFIFGLGQVPPQVARLTLIFEFVLPDMDWKTFQNQAANWKALGKSPQTLPEGNLQNVIEQSGYQNAGLIRIRSNCNEGSRWQFSQWTFQEATKTALGSFGRTPLDYQVDSNYTTILPIAGHSISAEDEKKFNSYVNLWASAHTDGRTPIPVNGAMSPKTATYQFLDAGPFLGPPATLNYSPDLAVTRDVIATQQCTGCHSRETKNMFLQHISETGVISDFLRPTGEWKVSLKDLTSMKATLAVNVSYCVTESASTVSSHSAAPNCAANQRLITETRNFNDLARRKLFMATLLAAPKNRPGPKDVQSIMDYAPNFAH